MIRWIVVGIGDITTKRVLPAIQAEARSQLVGIVTRTAAKASSYNVPAFKSVTAALAGCEADAVYVASPVALHAPQTIESLRAGKHVLCEKPMAMNYAEACAMNSVAVETGRTLGVAYYRRMYPNVNRAKQLMESGAIGRPVFAYATLHTWFTSYEGRGWLIKPSLAGGGPLYDVASHRIDLMHYLFGSPKAATGLRSSAVHYWSVEDNATVLIEHESGVRSCIDVRWHSKVERDEFFVRGTEGQLEMTPLNSGTIVWDGGKESHPPHANLHYPCVENFVSALSGETTLRATGASALLTDWVTAQVSG